MFAGLVDACSSQDKLFRFTVALHNEINRHTNKKQRVAEDVAASYDLATVCIENDAVWNSEISL